MQRATMFPVQVGQDSSALRNLNSALLSEGEPVIVTVGAAVLQPTTTAGHGLVRTPFCSSDVWQVPGFRYSPAAHVPFKLRTQFTGGRLPFVPGAKAQSGGIYVFLGTVVRGGDGCAVLDPIAASHLEVPQFDPGAYEYAGECQRALDYYLGRNSNRLRRAGAKLDSTDFLELLGETVRYGGTVLKSPGERELTALGQRLELSNRRTANLFAAAAV